MLSHLPSGGNRGQLYWTSSSFTEFKLLLTPWHLLQRLAKEHRKQAGISDTPTSDMYGECQELLQMFGLPYIIAPVEAEAQCAWLDSNGLVDGVVTDDNDVFLFGGQHIYRLAFRILGVLNLS